MPYYDNSQFAVSQATLKKVKMNKMMYASKKNQKPLCGPFAEAKIGQTSNIQLTGLIVQLRMTLPPDHRIQTCRACCLMTAIEHWTNFTSVMFMLGHGP